MENLTTPIEPLDITDGKMPAYDTFTYWFYINLPLSTKNYYTYFAINKATGDFVTSIAYRHGADTYEILDELKDADEVTKVYDDFNMFRLRPEFYVGQKVDIDRVTMLGLPSKYMTLMRGLMLIRAAHAGKNPDDYMPHSQKLLDWLASTDFYSCPASTKYHEAHPSGLLLHSLRVYNCIIDMMNVPQFNNCSSTSAALIALTHDWCKIGYYESYKRNVKNEAGQWEQVTAYQTNQKGVPLGHGVTSMFLASKFFTLSPEEAAAIRWHMGRWNAADIEQGELQLANEHYPLVYLLQFADQLAVTSYNK